MSDALCSKHNNVIEFVCTLQKCPQGHLICDTCKQLEAEHFAQHLNFIYHFKQFTGFQNPKSYRELLPKLQKAIQDCQLEMNGQKNICNQQITQINQDFKRIHNIFEDAHKKALQSILDTFTSDSKKHQEKLQFLKTQLKNFANKREEQTSFFGSLFTSEEIRANSTVQLVDKILTKNRPMFKIRAQLLFFNNQIKKSASRLPKYKKTERAKDRFNTMCTQYESIVRKMYYQLNDLFGEQQMRKSMVGDLRKTTSVNLLGSQTNSVADNRSLYQSKASTTSRKTLKTESELSQRNQIPPNLPKTTYPALHPTIAAILNSIEPMPVNSLGLKQQGPYKYKEGVYIGNYNNRMRHGKGKFVFNDGTYYEGYWRNDGMFGVGRLITKNFFYQGEINNGKAEGNGRMEDIEKIYNGQWHQDLKHGQGRLQYKNGKIKYSGGFLNNMFHGQGILETDQWIYQGGFWAGQKSGDGVLKYHNKQLFIGKFRNDLKLFGRYTFPDGTWYQGIYEKDLPHGNGTFYWPDGIRYEGLWRRGQQHGLGKEIYLDGRQRRGEWQNGEWKRWI